MNWSSTTTSSFSAFSAPSAVRGMMRAFQYALSSRKYWKVLQFSPVFGFKRAMRFPFIRKGLRRKKGHFLCMKRL